MRITMLTDKQLTLIAESDTPDDAGMSNLKTTHYREATIVKDVGISPFVWSQMRVMAMEILEFRRSFGSLGCEWLEC